MGFQRHSLVFRLGRMKRFLRHSLELHRNQIRMGQPFRRHTMDQLHRIRMEPFRLRTMVQHRNPKPFQLRTMGQLRKYRSTSS